MHWLLKFCIGVSAGLAIGLGIGIPTLAVILAIYFGTAFSKGSWKV